MMITATDETIMTAIPMGLMAVVFDEVVSSAAILEPVTKKLVVIFVVYFITLVSGPVKLYLVVSSK